MLVADNEVDLNDSNNTPVEIKDASFNDVSKKNYIVGDLFIVKLLDKNGTGISNKTVYFTINGKISKVVTDGNGDAKLALKLKKGFYTINYNFNETEYNPIQGFKDILLLSKPVSAIKGSTMKAYAGIKRDYKVILKADGIPLPNRVVKFVINKKKFYMKTDSNGIASMNIYLPKGTYKIKYYYGGEENIKSSSSSSKIKLKLLKNPYNTKYRHVYIDGDGGFTKSFLKSIASKLRKGGWKVTVYGIGPGEHSKNYKKVKNGVYMPFYNGLCAATIKEMGASYYGGLIKRHKSVLAPSWYNGYGSSKMLTSHDNDISKITFLKRAWDDNFSPKSYKGMYYPADYMNKHNIKYTVGVTTYEIAEQFLYGGWVAHH